MNSVENRWRGWRSLPQTLRGAIVFGAIGLFLCSSLRHGLFQSNAWDLGIFDQPLYLLSRGLPPVSTIIGVHILGDHAAWIFYPIALLYWIYPTVHWLFAIQAIALAIGALPSWHLAKQAGLQNEQAIAIAMAYLLYPLIFNLNLFDFHPEVIALPLMLTAVCMARANHITGFTLCIWVALGCRDALSLTIAAMGVWLGLFEKRRWEGAIAFFSGATWFVLATQVIIPHFQPAGVLGMAHYAEFGKTIPEIAMNLVLRPDLLLRRLLTEQNLGYLVFLLVPFAWAIPGRKAAGRGQRAGEAGGAGGAGGAKGAGKVEKRTETNKHSSSPHLLTSSSPHPFHWLPPLIAAVPQLALNLLSDHPAQKDLLHQYSLPIVPFLLLSAIAALAASKSWLQRPRHILLWSLIAFAALAQVHLFGTRYLSLLDTWGASRGAIAQVTTKGAVLSPAALVPHLAHRSMIKVVADSAQVPLAQFDYLLFNQRHPGRMTTPETVASLIQQASQSICFETKFHQQDVILFRRTDLCPR
jgi:uncharacterized membrane protein